MFNFNLSFIYLYIIRDTRPNSNIQYNIKAITVPIVDKDMKYLKRVIYVAIYCIAPQIFRFRVVIFMIKLCGYLGSVNIHTNLHDIKNT